MNWSKIFSRIIETNLVTRNQLIAEGQARHQTAFLHPEYWCEASWEEDAFNGRECHYPLPESRCLAADPLQGPIGLLLDARKGLHGVEEKVPERDCLFELPLQPLTRSVPNDILFKTSFCTMPFILFCLSFTYKCSQEYHFCTLSFIF